MDRIETTNLPENMLTDAKMEIPATSEQITLTKMEIIDAQTEVHLEDSDSQHLVETQYINLHGVGDLTKNLGSDTIPAELLSHHVVDLATNPEYSQHVVTSAQFYDNAEFLSTNFTDDERRLELVAVQFMQQNRADSSTCDSNLNADLLNGKTTLSSVTTISSDKTVMSAIANYVHAVDSSTSPSPSDLGIHLNDHSQVPEQHIVKGTVQSSDQLIKIYPTVYQQNQDKLHILPPLKKLNPTLSTINGTTQNLIVTSGMNIQQSDSHQDSALVNGNFKTECMNRGELNTSSDATESATAEEYETDGDNEAQSSQKSLPHKKRIPNKLKKAQTAPSRNMHTKCYKCTKCGEQFPTQASFNSHKLVHSSSKKMVYACELCNKTCTNQLKFFEHLKSHYEPGMAPYSINTKPTPLPEESKFEPVENEQSQGIEMDQDHSNPHVSEDQQSEFANEPTPFTCEKCGRVFRRQKAYDCHMSISHPKQEEIEEFSEPEDMMEGIRHVVNMVPTGDEEDKNFEGSSWSAPKGIENVVISQQQPQQVHQKQQPNHVQNAVSVTPKPATSQKTTQVKKETLTDDDDEDDQPPAKPRKEMNCPHCERTFVHRNSLLYHIRSHTGHRPHQCELCGKSFFAAGALKIHHRLHSGDKPYKCEYCGRFFRQWGDLKYHFTSLHSNTKMFQCEYCGKDFARKYSLVVHRRIHTGEKNYICEFCTKTFRAASYLQNHRRIHTGEKPHACQVCGKPFRVRSDMKRHMKTHPDVNVVNVLADVSNNTAEANSTEVREMCVINNQEVTIAKQEEQMESPSIVEQEVEQNIGTPLNLNVRPASTTQEEIYNYQRDDLVDRENTGTLYVWIQTNSDTILPDA